MSDFKDSFDWDKIDETRKIIEDQIYQYEPGEWTNPEVLFQPDEYYSVVDEFGNRWTYKRILKFIADNKLGMYLSENNFEFQINPLGDLELVDDYGREEIVGPPEFNIVWNWDKVLKDE